MPTPGMCMPQYEYVQLNHKISIDIMCLYIHENMLHKCIYIYISYHSILYHIMSYHIITCHVISYHIISCRIILFHIILSHIISDHIILFHIILSHIVYIYIYYLTYNIYLAKHSPPPRRLCNVLLISDRWREDLQETQGFMVTKCENTLKTEVIPGVSEPVDCKTSDILIYIN